MLKPGCTVTRWTSSRVSMQKERIDGAARSCNRGRSSPPRNSARQRSAFYPARRVGSESLPRFAAGEYGLSRHSSSRLLPDDKPRPPYRHPGKGRCTGTRVEGDTRPVRFLLERSTPFDGACLAGAILFLSSG